MLDIAIVEGVRTPFVKAFGPLASTPAHELGRTVTVAVLERAGVAPEQIDQVVFGTGAGSAEAPNAARVIGLLSKIPQDRIAHTVQRNCASGMEAITTAAQILQLGEAKTVLAGGTESMSQIPLIFGREATGRFLDLAQAKGWKRRLQMMLRFRPRHFKPIPAVKIGLTDPVCGLLMGETAEVLAEEFGVSRTEQDEFALESHRRAVAAQERCVLSEEIVPVTSASGESREERRRPAAGADVGGARQAETVLQGGRHGDGWEFMFGHRRRRGGNPDARRDGAQPRADAARLCPRLRLRRLRPPAHGARTGLRQQQGLGTNRPWPQGHRSDRDQ